jgi:hypothetical protein
MEKMMTKGLALEELEAHSFAQLLPDRIEMHRRRRSVHRRHKRRRSGNVECTATNVGGLVNKAFNIQACNRINA